MTEKIAVRGLSRLTGWILIPWGAFMSQAEIAARHEDAHFVPDGWEIYRRYLAPGTAPTA